MKSGLKTTEFWVAITTPIVMALWPDFPKESLAAVVAYIAGRVLVKFKNGGTNET